MEGIMSPSVHILRTEGSYWIWYKLLHEVLFHHDQSSSFDIMGVTANLIVLTLTLVGVSARNLALKSFIQLQANSPSDPIPYCDNGEWVTCDRAIVDFEALRGNQTLTLPLGATVSPFESSPGSEPGSTTVFYQSEDLLDSMSITFFASGSNEVNAIIHEDDRVFYLAPCDQTGGDCHVLAEESSDMFNVEDVESKPTMRELELMTKEAVEGYSDLEDRQEQGRFQQDADGTFVATIKVYYTSEFAQAEPNVGAYISNMLSQANAGFRNSQTNFRLQLLCTQQLDNITENRDPEQILIQFRNIKGSYANLRGTADFAHLLVRETTSTNCGIGYLGSTAVPFGVSKRVCAIATYTFIHEVGHNLGCSHDRATEGNNDQNLYAFGYRIPNTRHHTIMAYSNRDFPFRINLFSNPNVQFQNQPIGNAQNNCARRIREVARTFASIGSDTDTCGSTPATTTTTTTTTTQSTSQTVISTCSALLSRFVPSGTSVVIQYPLFGNYGNNQQCVWLLYTTSGGRLRIQIQTMDIERASNCSYDLLAIFGTTAGNIGFCGTGSSNSYTSGGNGLRIRFTSDALVVGSGFRAIVQAL